MIDVAGPPARWIAYGGRPSEATWAAHDGLPSYESDTGKILVYDLLLAAERQEATELPGGIARVAPSTMFVSHHYGMVATRSVLVGDHELCALHDDPDAAWVWRPLVYGLAADGLTRLGSQQELEWRWSLQQMQEARQDQGDALGEFMLAQALRIKKLYGRMPPLDRARERGEKRLRKNARKRLYREYLAFLEQQYEDVTTRT